MSVRVSLALAGLLFSIATASADLRGHGGPVRALAVSPDGVTAVSGGFDNSVIRWSLEREAAMAVIRFHDGPVNAVALLPDGRAASGGEDMKIAIWGASPDTPERVLEGHEAKVAALAALPDGRLVSGGWDGTVRVWSVATGTHTIAARHQGHVNAVAVTPDGQQILSAGSDLTLRITPVAGGADLAIAFSAPVNTIGVAPDGEIVAAGADGSLRFLQRDGTQRAELEGLPAPIVAVAISPDGRLIAAAGLRGAVAIIERQTRARINDLVGPRFPVWSLAFSSDSRTLLTGGADRTIRRWDPRTGASASVNIQPVDPEARLMASGERGAIVFRACIACHTLTPDAGNRAGPTLHGVFGRRIGTAGGYSFSPALRSMDIVWSKDTIARLFEIGPNAYTPGTKMPEQTIGDEEDRRALVEWLQRVTQ